MLFNKMSQELKVHCQQFGLNARVCGSLLYRTWRILNVDINFVRSSFTKKIENVHTRGGNSLWVSLALLFIVCN